MTMTVASFTRMPISGVFVAVLQQEPLMTMPGFMAEASLTNSSGTYRAARRFLDKDGQANVTPAVGKLCDARRNPLRRLRA
jgi:hypothetical protein